METLLETPIGCFCHIMGEKGCLTCTCPDCGAFGRFGAPISHVAPCPVGVDISAAA